jgi:hypothetical protein
MELVENPFHAYCLFSPDFEHYIDVFHLKIDLDSPNQERAQLVIMNVQSAEIVSSTQCDGQDKTYQEAIDKMLRGASEVALKKFDLANS